MKCPRPIIEIAKAARKLSPGGLIHITADDLAFESDVNAWAENVNAEIMKFEKNDGKYNVSIKTATLS